MLVEDDRVFCEDESHRMIQHLSLGVIAIVAIGVPIYFGCWIAVSAHIYAQGSEQGVTQVHSHEDRADKPSLAQRVIADKWGDPSFVAHSDLAEMEGVIRDVTVLSDFSILIGAYTYTRR